MFQGKKTLPNPVDMNYESLHCNMELLDKKSDEFKVSQYYYICHRLAGCFFPFVIYPLNARFL